MDNLSVFVGCCLFFIVCVIAPDVIVYFRIPSEDVNSKRYAGDNIIVGVIVSAFILLLLIGSSLFFDYVIN